MKPAGSFAAAIFTAIASALAAAGGVVLLAGCTSCQTTVRTATMPVIAAGTFDVLEADQTSHRLYLADRTSKGVDVVDISSATPRFLSTIKLDGAPNGLALAPDRHRLYAAVAGGTVAVIDTEASSPKSMQVIESIKVHTANADLLDYSPKTQRLYVGTGEEVVTVDTATNKVRLRLAAKTTVEQPRYDPADGMVYVTAPGPDSLLQINPATGNVTRTYVIKKCHPAGLGINPTRQLAMVTCGGSVGLVNLNTGAQEVSRVVQGGDIVTYDSSADRFVVASPHGGSDSAVGIFSGSGEFLGSVAATPKAHAAAFDALHGVVYTPSTAGLMSFTPAACAPPSDWLKFLGGLSVFAVPFLAFALFLFLYARGRGRRTGQPSGPSFRDLQEQDLEMERERMRALEEGILGPEG